MDTADAVDFYISYSPADDRWATWLGWTLTDAGFRVRLQAWDFMPGTNYTEFTDAGVRNAAVVIAVLSRSYSGSRHGMEWQAALRHDPRKLVMVRVEDCPLDGLLAPIKFVDLVGQRDDRVAAQTVVQDLGRILETRADTHEPPPFPGRNGSHEPASRRRVPASPPAFPPSLAPSSTGRESLSVLHVPGPRFGRGLARDDAARTALDLQYQIFGDVSRLIDAGVPPPDLVVVTGDVTEAARPSQVMQALEFLQGLGALLRLEADRLVVVPGRRDVSYAACQAYFSECEANERTPVEPYFPKLRQFTTLLEGLRPGLDGPGFDEAQPWGLVPIPQLRLVVAALNSTMAITHRPDDDHGLLGQRQTAWFAEHLRPFEQAGWMRIGAVHHDPTPAGRAAGMDPLLMRDADVFDRLVGSRLHLLIHGPALGGTGTDTLGSGLVTVGAPAVSQAELVQLTAAGLRRFPVEDPDAGRSAPLLERPWPSADAAFGATDAGDLDDVPEQEPARPTGPQGLLLERITEVCVARDDRARVRLVDVEPPYLLVTRREEGFTPQQRIGAHVGEVTRDVLTAFCTHTTDAGAELVYEGPNPPQTLREEATRRGVRLRSFTEFQGLLDLSDFLARQTAKLRADRRYPPSLYVPQRYRDLDQPGREVRDDLATELVEQLSDTDHGRFVLVLGEFGHGKTFVMREIARRLAETSPTVIPILIELRTLDTANSVEALVAAHLANEGETRIDINAFRYMLREGRIVLLFDGFDELVTRISYDRAAEHLSTLLQAAQGRAKIVVASRTQHFRSHGQVVTALGERVEALSQRRIIGVEDFTPAQIRAYLLNRYHGDDRRADARLRLLQAVQSLADLGQNPRMLSFIADLPDERLRAAARSGNAIGASGLYREIIDTWLGFETDRAADRTTAQSGRPAPAGLTAADRKRAATALAVRLWETGAAHLGLADLAEVVDALTDMAHDELSGPQVVHAVASGSLLVRTDDGLFGFIHRSVMEWLVADAIAEELRAGARSPALLHRSQLSQLIVDFLCELADPRHCRAWVDAVLTDPRSGELARANAMKISSRLRIPATADLRGASLVGEDLSYRDLDGVDLTGADLTGARLVGADLRDARLGGARLVGARLDEARMAGADLRGADLTRARLTGADITGAQLTGSVWRRAALIGAAGVPDDPAGLHALRGAAIAPGQPVTAQLAPAAVGVRHGFHPELGRLPQVLAYSPDGGLLAVGSDDGGVLICSAVTGRALRTLQGHRDRVFAVTYGDDVLVTGSADGTVRVWDAATGDCRHVLTGHDRWPWPVMLDPTAEMLGTGDAAGVLRLWDVATGELLQELPGGRGFVVDMAWRGNLVAAVCRDGSVRLWDTASGASLGELTGPGEQVYRVAFSPAGDLLATGGRGGDVRTWDPATGRARGALPGLGGGVYAIAFHPTERLLAGGDGAGGVRIWDLDSGQPQHVLTGHTESVHGLAFSPAGNLLATGDSAGKLVVWDAATGQVRHTLAGHTGAIWPFAFRPDGAQLAVSDDELTLRLWDPTTGHCRHVVSGHGRQVMSVHYDSTGASLATSSNDGTVRLWEPATGRLVRRLKDSADQFVKLETAVFSPAAPRLAIISNDGRLNLFNLPDGRFERHIKVEPAPVWAVAFSPSGDILATANDDDTVRLWDRTLGRLVHTLTEHAGRVRSIAYSDDGRLLATGCDDGQVRLWDAATGKLVRTLAGHTDRVYAVDFADGLLASGSWDGTARVWDVATASTRHVLDQHGGRLWTVAFDRSGATLATAGDDLAIRLWDPRTGALDHTLTGHTGSVQSVAFHPAGRQLASGGADGTVRLWSSDAGTPVRTTLLGLSEGWAAFTPDGRYKADGKVASQFWHVVGMCRFEIGELDAHLAEVARVPIDAPLS